MPKVQAEVAEYIRKHLPDFHRRRLKSLEGLKLNRILLRKNPYLFRVKSIQTADELVRSILDAHLSSQEETIFGSFLEGIAVFACAHALGGKKSAAEGIDLEFDRDQTRYIVSIKSGPNWGNSGQIKKMGDNFRKASQILRSGSSVKNVRAVNGCCYGRELRQDKGNYLKVCGADFWSLISGDPALYTELIEPLGHRARERNEDFHAEYGKVVNRFTKEFVLDFCHDDGAIDWNRLVKFNSGNEAPRTRTRSRSQLRLEE